MYDNLIECRLEWERGLTPVFVKDEQEGHARVLVILTSKRKPDGFYCHRYCRMGDKWDVSADGQQVPLEAVWAWLMNPGAAATKPPYRTPPSIEQP